MAEANVERFEPVYLEPESVGRLTEYGKRWLNNRFEQADRHWSAWKDICKLAAAEATRWADIEAAIAESGVPTALTGMSQYAMAKAIDNVNQKTQWTIGSVFAVAGSTATPTTTTTGVIGANETTNYTGYARVSVTPSTGLNAATAATPSVATNNGAITFPACTASTATWLGVVVTDNVTLNTGNALWVISISSVVISTTQTPPTIATTAMSLSLTGS